MAQPLAGRTFHGLAHIVVLLYSLSVFCSFFYFFVSKKMSKWGLCVCVCYDDGECVCELGRSFECVSRRINQSALTIAWRRANREREAVTHA